MAVGMLGALAKSAGVTGAAAFKPTRRRNRPQYPGGHPPLGDPKEAKSRPARYAAP